MTAYARLSQGRLDNAIRSLALAWNDILAAGLAVETLLAHPSYGSPLDGERQALAEAVIAAYSRPFDKDRRGVNLGSEWPGYERPDWSDQHKRLMSCRHAFISHSERDARRVIVRSTEAGDGWRMSLDLPPLFLVPGEAERTDGMCRDLLDRLHDELGRACRALIERERVLRPGPVEVRIPR